MTLSADPHDHADPSVPHDLPHDLPQGEAGHGSDHGVDQHSSHEGSGYKLIAATDDEPPPGSTCERDAAVREERIVALSVDITVNRYGDHDPEGQMFARETEVDDVRAEEERNRRARTGDVEPGVTAGLQGDAIQPLVIRVLPGECLRVTLRNDLADARPASLAVHGAGLQVVGGGPATVTNADALVAAGESLVYEWQVPADEPEGSHYLHSGGDERTQVEHGLFGALIVEPAGSTWRDPRTGEAPSRGWDAVIERPDGTSFREFALIYHEIGNDAYQLTDRHGAFVPLVDPLTDAYRPASKALNYRSEPFSNRLELGLATTGRLDESLAYSSYAYGDPATPILRSYIGEPVKQRLIHGGSEVSHVHHLHGGATRWPRQPGAEPAPDPGLEKKPPLVPDTSERTDSQSVGPSEVFDIATECGSGGCQQSVGDFMYHCHIAQHYFAGMWGLWRVYNTLQVPDAATDELPPLPALDDGGSAVVAAVTASGLVDTTVDFYGTRTTLDAATLPSWIERHLPPAGTPKGYDASVWDWIRDDDRWLGEPETSATWPGYRARAPGTRPDLLFDPRTGRPAYPLMRPHLAARPPFAPNHGPAPHLDPTANGDDLPVPGANGAASLCPEGTIPKQLDVNAVHQPVPLNAKQGLLDGKGMLFVLRQQLDEVRDDPSLQVPLAVRANAGEDCVDILLRSELDDAAFGGFSKVGLHVHFVQFDVQASDGLDAGFNYEQTIRPFRADGAGTGVAAPAPAGSTSVRVGESDRFSVGAVVGIGADQEETFESRRIVGVRGDELQLDRPLGHPHAPGEIVTTEFVRYRWYPDAQFGTAYFHDHVDAIHTWAHGLFGALIAEPPGSTYTHPRTGAPLLSGPIADIHTAGAVSTDVSGSFRELALFIQDDNRLNQVGRSTGSAFGMRAEPLDRRKGPSEERFSSRLHGDPATALLEANLGDPVVIRSLVGSTNDIHTLHVDGHWFRSEPWSPTSSPISTIRVGISERFDLVVPAAGGPQRMPGDYLYHSGRPAKLREGSWGLVRVHPPGHGDLVPLPGHETPPAPATEVCPADAPVRQVSVTAMDVALPMLDGAPGKVFVRDDQVQAVEEGTVQVEPLVVHANVGDCIEVTLTNDTSDGPVTYHCDLLAADPSTSGGVAAGYEPARAVQPGDSGTFTYYASPEVGETVAMIRDFGDGLVNPGLGLYGAVVVGAPGTTYRGEGSRVDAFPPDGDPYRDATLFFHDDDAGIGTHQMPYSAAVRGTVGLNYLTAPIDRRGGVDVASPYLSGPDRDPATPVLHAYAGERLRLHVLAPWSEQVQVFGLEGHSWETEPGLDGSNRVGSTSVGGLEAITIEPLGGAGGLSHVPGDYLYGDSRLPYREAGRWGILRVHDREERVEGLVPLVGGGSTRLWPWLPVTATGMVLVAGMLAARIRRARRAKTG